MGLIRRVDSQVWTVLSLSCCSLFLFSSLVLVDPIDNRSWIWFRHIYFFFDSGVSSEHICLQVGTHCFVQINKKIKKRIRVSCSSNKKAIKESEKRTAE